MNVGCSERAAESPGTAGGAEPPLVVDLDGTLVKTDLLIETVLALLIRQPLWALMLPVWLLHGKARLKHEVARRVTLEIAELPWRSDFIESLRQQRGKGRLLVLATGSDLLLAQQVAQHLKLFDLVLASDGTNNLCGQAKRDLLVDQFGERGFDYAADGGGRTRNDTIVWAAARNAIRIGPTSSGFVDHLRALRPSHWLKNVLIFVPLFAAHRFDFSSVKTSSLAFLAFGCCAAGGYLFNDLVDLRADRHHPHKRLRPFASGTLPLSYALTTIPILLATGGVLGALISLPFLGVVIAYFVLSALYSLRLKKVAVLDVLFLAGLYTVRIIAGSVASGIWLSEWLLAFSMFFFFSLALVKRYAELVIMRSVDHDGAHARAYELDDGELLAAMGTASGYLAAMVLSLYIASDKAHSVYHHVDVLWVLCLLLLYWISHVWLTAHRGKMHDDPLVFATTDTTSRILLVLMMLTVVVAL